MANVRSIFFCLLYCILGGAFIIFVLLISASGDSGDKNGFKRVFRSDTIAAVSKLQFKYAGYYFAGINSTTIYLGNYYSPFFIYKIKSELSDSVEVQLKLSNVPGSKSITATVDSPNLFLACGNPPFIARSVFPDLNLIPLFLQAKPFSAWLPIGGSCIILRTYDSKRKQYDLVRQEIDRKTGNLKFSNVLRKQVDGTFCLDGLMHYNKKTKRIVYAYRYRNEFICLDTNLKVLYKGHTVDTNQVAKVAVSKTEKQSLLAASTRVINRTSCISDKYVFIVSNVKADNEGENEFKQNAVIDVYLLENGKYQFSFYLPKIENENLYYIRVVNDRIFSMYEHWLVCYRWK